MVADIIGERLRGMVPASSCVLYVFDREHRRARGNDGSRGARGTFPRPPHSARSTTYGMDEQQISDPLGTRTRCWISATSPESLKATP